MEITKLIEAIKEGKKSVFENMVKEEGRTASLSSVSEIVGRRAYFTIDETGVINRKSMNYALPLGAFTLDEEKLGEQLFQLADPKERIKHKKIERLSREDIGKLYKNFFKVMANNNVDFAKRYSKEMYLRDKDSFFKKLFNYTLLEGIDSQKTLMALALKKLLWNQYDDNIMNAGITYIASVKADFADYEAAEETLEKSEVLLKAEDLRHGTTKEELNLLSYLKVLGEYTYSNEGIFAAIAHKKMTEKVSKIELNCYEKEIMKGL